MRLIRTLAGMTLAACALTACAQSEIVSITDWRMHTGDDPSWSRPDLDDSAWAKSAFPVMVFRDTDAGWHWYRSTFSIPSDFHGQELGLGFGALDDVYEVYINGVTVGRFGSFEPTPRAIYPRHFVLRVPRALLQGSTVHIAIRRWRGPWSVRLVAFSCAGTFRRDHPPQLGALTTIVTRENLDMAAGAIESIPWDLTDAIFFFAAVISFVLYSTQRRRAEYLYLGLLCIASAAQLIGIPVALSHSLGSRSWQAVLVFFGYSLTYPSSIAFLASMCPRYRNILRAGAILFAVDIVLFSLVMATDFSGPRLYIASISYVLPLFELLAAWGLLLDRNRGSSIIAIALLLHRSVQIWHNTRALQSSIVPRDTISAGAFSVDLRSLSSVLFIFTVLVVLYLRYRGEQVRQAMLEQGMTAAQRMQKQLLGAGAESTSGFSIDAVYRPAQEVGGDFYRTDMLEDGSLLVVVGDVSGKGLDAAFLVAAVLGALAIERERNPGRLLENLNRAVSGRTGGGFITASCARFFPDGHVAIANAGHLFPYVDGHELLLENGFPLGMSENAAYAETVIKTSSTVVFLSDGVVEARDGKGELLGFDRMAAMTTKSASEIADIAQRWGQEDDITVLTIRRTVDLDPASMRTPTVLLTT